MRKNLHRIIFSFLLFQISAAHPGAADEVSISLEPGYSRVGGYYSGMFHASPSVAFRINPVQWKFLFADGSLSYASYEMKSIPDSFMRVAGLDAGFNGRYRIGLFEPFAGVSAGARYLHFRGSRTNEEISTYKPSAGVRAGCLIRFSDRFNAVVRSDYSVNTLSGEKFTQFTAGAGLSYLFGVAEPSPRIVEVIKVDYYVEGLNAMRSGNISLARNNFGKVERNSPSYNDALKQIADIDAAVSSFNEAKKLIADGKKFEAIPYLEKAALIAESGRLLESIRTELRKEIVSLERAGIAAYDAKNYTLCMTVMRRILLIDPNNITAKDYLPRAEKRDEALRRLK